MFGDYHLRDFFNTFIYFNWSLITLQYCIGFAIYQYESTTGIHVFPILNPSPSSIPVPSLWVVSVHQPQASSIMHEPGLVIHFIYDVIHVSMPFSQILPPLPSPTESKRLFYTTVSLLLSRIQGYRYYLSKFHIYAIVNCIDVFLSSSVFYIFNFIKPIIFFLHSFLCLPFLLFLFP